MGHGTVKTNEERLEERKKEQTEVQETDSKPSVKEHISTEKRKSVTKDE